MYLIGLDIGGANLKAADSTGQARSRAFALWRAPERLCDELAALLSQYDRPDRVLVTMTAELCDCFEAKAEGVRFVLRSLKDALQRLGLGRCGAEVWTVRGRFVPVEEAVADPTAVAAANWLALATWAAQRLAPHAGLLIDVGSTTTDIVLLQDGLPRPQGLDDLSRLSSRELIYLGVRRTPVAMLVDCLPWRGRMVPAARELFATVADAFLLTGDLPEQPDCTDTADGRPMTRAHAAQRLARMLCLDAERSNQYAIEALARHVAFVARQQVAEGVASRLRAAAVRPDRAVVAGEGEFLARQALASLGWAGQVLALSELAGQPASVCGPAWALVQLAEGACNVAGGDEMRR